MDNLGKQGEQIFRYMMKNRGYTVQDVTYNPEYWDKDIDFIVTSPFTGAVKSFEVKYDSRISFTGNLYLEITNIYSKQWNYEGWFNHCDADFLAYGDAAARKFYIIPMDELRKRVQELPRRVASCGADSTGLLVSLEDIKDITKTIN